MASSPASQLLNIVRTQLGRTPGLARQVTPLIPPYTPPHVDVSPPSTSSKTPSTFPKIQPPGPLTSEVLQETCNKYAILSSTDVQSQLHAVWVHGLPEGCSPVMMRAAILSKSLHLPTESLLEALEVFARCNCADQLFFKEVSKVLFGRIKDMSILQVCRMLRVYDSASLGECVVNEQLYARISSIVNRANIPQIVDILWTVSASDTKLMDRSKIAELCLNRYSLYLRSELGESVDMDLKTLGSMCRLRIVHEGTLRKINRRVMRYYKEISDSDYIRIVNYFNALDVPLDALERKARIGTSLAGAVVSANCTVRGVSCPATLIRACCSELNDGDSSAEKFKQKLGLLALGLLEPVSVLHVHLHSLPLEELKYISELLTDEEGLVERKSYHFDDKQFLLKPGFILGGVLRVTEMGEALPSKKKNANSAALAK